MSRWLIEKSGTGIEKSGTGIEKSGTGIEKSGTGIEKSGTGIEKSGTGIRQAFLTCLVAAVMISSNVTADESLNPAGSLQIVADRDTLAVSWIIDGSVFSGVTEIGGSFANLLLTEIGLAPTDDSLLVAGSGSGKEVAGSGTGTEVAGSGSGTEVAGSGTGTEIAGSGTGIEVAGSGTGTEVAGSGTGTDVAGSGTGTDVAGSGTGTDVAGSGTGAEGIATGSTILVAGSGTGSEAISITLPAGTGLQMEVVMGCKTASVSVLDANYAEVVTFNNVPVIGNTGFCSDNAIGDIYEKTLPIKYGDGKY